VDALYIADPDDGELSIALIQCSYSTPPNGEVAFSERGIARIIDSIGTLFDPRKSVHLNPRLEKWVEEIRSFVREGVVPRITAIATSNGAPWTKEAQQRIDNASKKYEQLVDWQFIGADDLLALSQAGKQVNDELKLVGQATVETFKFRRVLIGRMPVSELARLIDKYDSRLFERNTCRYLGLTGNRVSEAMANTLHDPNQRPNFYFYNNGITIICSHFSHNALQQQNWTVRASDLQIVNGGQTARTVQKAYERGENLEGADVLVRIYELNPEDAELVKQITLATNSRIPVNLRDLRANDRRQLVLKESIAGLGYTYVAKCEDRVGSRDEFTSVAVAEAVLAVWRQRPHQARFSVRQHFDSLYGTIFTPDLTGSQAIVATLLLRQAENRRKRPPNDAPDFLPYGSRFVAMLMGVSLLEEMNIELEQLDHRNFRQASELVEQRSVDYMKLAEKRVEEAVAQVFQGRKRTLQRLAVTFRREDLIDMLLGVDGDPAS